MLVAMLLPTLLPTQLPPIPLHARCYATASNTKNPTLQRNQQALRVVALQHHRIVEIEVKYK
jgi:hypothetical protein